MLVPGVQSVRFEIFTLLGRYAAQIDSQLPTFRDNLSVSSSRIKQLWPLNTGPTGCPETSESNYQPTLRNIPEDQRSHLHRGGSLRSSVRFSLTMDTSLKRVFRVHLQLRFNDLKNILMSLTYKFISKWFICYCSVKCANRWSATASFNRAITSVLQRLKLKTTDPGTNRRAGHLEWHVHSFKSSTTTEMLYRRRESDPRYNLLKKIQSREPVA